MRCQLVRPLVFLGICAGVGLAQEEPAYTVTFLEPRTEVANLVQPLDPTPRIAYQYVGAMAFGLTVDQRHMLCCGPGAIRTTFRVDDAIVHPNVVGKGLPLPPDKFGKVRQGMQSSFAFNNVHITQVLELIPSRAAPGARRQLDTVLIRYLIENRGLTPTKVGTRVRIDTMCGNNDGALFAAPTRPGEILNGVELSGKTLPEYVQILERPNLKDPGFVGHYTLSLPGKRIGPDRFLCTAHGGVDNGWDAGLIQSNGDSDAVLFWSPREVKAGAKIEMAYAYGRGVAALPEGEGRVKLVLGGSFEPSKLFTVQAYVEEPVLGQTLALELPPGMTLVEGQPIQPAIPAADNLATTVVLWKARVDRPGEFPLRVRSSNGISETRTIAVTRGR